MAHLPRPLTRRLLPRLISGALPRSLARLVHSAVRADPELSAAYHALRVIEGAGQTAAVPLSNGQLDLIESLLVLDDGAPSSATEARTSAWLTPLSGLTAAAALALFFVIPHGESASIHVGELRARGERLAAAPLGVTVTCLSSDGARVIGTATAGARQSVARLACAPASLLAFSTINLAQVERHVFVVGVGQDGGRRYYAPFDERGAALPMKPGVSDGVLGTAADTSNMPHDSDVALFVLVSDEPFTAASIERQLAHAQERGIALQSAERLPVDVPVQARIDMHVTGRASP